MQRILLSGWAVQRYGRGCCSLFTCSKAFPIAFRSARNFWRVSALVGVRFSPLWSLAPLLLDFGPVLSTSKNCWNMTSVE